MDYLLAPVISPDEIAFLRLLIEQNHLDFKVLYPNCSITPKLHYMIHYPEYILAGIFCILSWTIIILYVWSSQ